MYSEVKGLVSELQTSVKKDDNGDLVATLKIQTKMEPEDLRRLFSMQKDGLFEWVLKSMQTEMFDEAGKVKVASSGGIEV